MISPLVLSRQPCMTPGAGQAFGKGLGGSGGGGGGVDDGPGLSSGSVVNGCDWASSKRAHPDPTSNAAHSRTITPRMGRRCLMQARLRIVRQCAPRSPPRRGGPGLANSAAKAPRQSSIHGWVALTLATVTSHPDPHAWQRPASASLVDPEDDLPSSNYAGDFETTAIPRYDSAKSSTDQPFGLISDPEPLPYVQPSGRHSLGSYAAEPPEIDPDAGDELARAAGRRGTQDLGLLLLRLAVGALLISHGLQKAFGWWDGPGFDGFETSLTDMGFQHANILTYVATGGQIAAGVLLILGLFTPVAAAGALAYLVTGILADAMTAHEEARLAS